MKQIFSIKKSTGKISYELSARELEIAPEAVLCAGPGNHFNPQGL